MDELDLEIEKLRMTLEDSQKSYYGGNIKSRLSVDKHFEIWDKMFSLKQKKLSQLNDPAFSP